MKQKFFTTLFLLFVSIYFFAQTRDLANLAEGKLVYGQILYTSDSKVYGYIYFFDQGKIDKENEKIEYVILDKNLNKVSNSTFIRRKFNFINRIYSDCSLINDDEIIIKYKLNIPAFGFTINSFNIITIKNKTISNEHWYKNGNIEEVPKTLKEFRKMLKHVNNSGTFYVDSKHNSIFIIEEYIAKFGSNKYIRFYNSKLELLWSYEYNPIGQKQNFKNISVLSISNDRVYLLESQNNSTSSEEYKIIALEALSGKKKFEYVFENKQSDFSHTLIVKEVNNQLILTGNYSQNKIKTDSYLDKNLGYYKIVLDETGKELSKKYTKWEDFKGKIEVDKNGKVENNYQLRTIQFFIFKDGSISILTEKYKPAKKGFILPIPILGDITQLATQSRQKTTDFILFNMDSDFTNQSVSILHKEITKGFNSDYLFSQYIKNESGVAFFFIDHLKSDGKSILGVNTIINGKLKEEKITIYSKEDKFSILPMIAKEGYIILREYNEKERYNQIRLEKINY
jgi:hypothetical protein